MHTTNLWTNTSKTVDHGVPFIGEPQGAPSRKDG